MTRIVLLYITVATTLALAYAGCTWWLTWRRNRKEDRAAYPTPPEMHGRPKPSQEPAHTHDFSGTELGYSLDRPAGSHLLLRLTAERRSLLHADDVPRVGTPEKPDDA